LLLSHFRDESFWSVTCTGTDNLAKKTKRENTKKQQNTKQQNSRTGRREQHNTALN